ncbi:MAG: nucleotidyltransferase family protein [Anaeromyxobacter sp.]
MNALLLAAGMGLRLRPLTDTVPKCLVPIRGRPLLAYWLDLLAQGGIDRVVVNTHYLSEQVVRFVESSPHRARVDLVHEDRLLGTGGSVLRHRALLGDGPFLLAHADNLTRFDVAAFLARHRTRPAGCALTMMTFETRTPESCGIVEVDARGVVVGFEEKPRAPRSRLANGAVYILEPEAVEALAALGKEAPDVSTELLPRYVGRMCTFHNAIYHRDIGSPEAYAEAQLDSAYQA